MIFRLSLLAATTISIVKGGRYIIDPDIDTALAYAPTCESVWDATNLPSFRDPVAEGTARFMFGLDSSAPLSFGMYITGVVASNFGGATPSPEQQTCQDILNIVNTGKFGASATPPTGANATNAIFSDVAKLNTVSDFPNNLTDYLSFHSFFEVRLCPCLTQISRSIMEPLNCVGKNGENTYSEMWFQCQTIDYKKIYSSVGWGTDATPGAFDWDGDKSNVDNWQGCLTPRLTTRFQSFTNGPSAEGAASYTLYNKRKDVYEETMDAVRTPVSVVPPVVNNATWLDDVNGNCMPCDMKEDQKAVAQVWGIYDREDVHQLCSHYNIWDYINMEKGKKGKKNNKGNKGKKAAFTQVFDTVTAKPAVTAAATAGVALLVAGAALIVTKSRKAREYEQIESNDVEATPVLI